VRSLRWAERASRGHRQRRDDPAGASRQHAVKALPYRREDRVRRSGNADHALVDARQVVKSCAVPVASAAMPLQVAV